MMIYNLRIWRIMTTFVVGLQATPGSGLYDVKC
jgi:hypothetical protein